jgi:large subunit ribosomal protein L14
MIFVESLLEIVDNSGGKQGRCIRVLTPVSLNCKRPGLLGNFILITVRKILIIKKVKKGNIYKGLIVRTSKIVERSIGFLKFDKNSIILLNKKNEPIGSRIKGILGKETRENKNVKITSLATGII